MSFALDEVAAAWWRKPNWFDIEREDTGTRISLEREVIRLQEDIWDFVPPAVWLNRPEAIRESSRRPKQLALAYGLGFAVPETLVTNSWRGPSRMAESGDIIFKSLRGVLLRKGVNRALFTTRLQASDIAGLNRISTPYPGLMQPYIEKLREWRVTVVEDATFASAIYAAGDGSSDWRQGQMTDSVRFTRDVLDETVESMCIALTKQLGLAFSAIDLIETPDGDFVFLEANPNGQYMWLELQLNLPISEKIADALVTRAFRS